MAERAEIDRAWLLAHPLPGHEGTSGKDDRGHVLVIGGSRQVPGGMRLAAEAALRAGAGRVQMATIEALAIPLGIEVPEAGVFALPEDAEGEVDWPGDGTAIADALGRCRCIVVGPAMGSRDAARKVVAAILAGASPECRIILDAAAVCAARDLAKEIRRRDVILTPNFGEAAQLLELDSDAVEGDPSAALGQAIAMTGAAVVLKGPESLVGAPDAAPLHYAGGGEGMATGGSGDVLAGILGGLLARGTPTVDACAWAVWLHGEAGRTLAGTVGELGYFARELAALVPGTMMALHDETKGARG